EWVSKRRNAALAEEAWANFVGALPDGQYSPDFAVGFKAGFEDYLFAGGNGEPPVVPPRGYWKPEFESPQGQEMMQDWFRGYRHGAAVAKDGGYREVITTRASAGLPRFMLPPPSGQPKVKTMPLADEPVPEPTPLPPPRPLPPPKAAAPAPRPLPGDEV